MENAYKNPQIPRQRCCIMRLPQYDSPTTQPCRAVTPWQPHKTIPYKTSRDAPWHVSTNERHKKSCQTGLGSALTCAPRLTTFLFQASSSCNGTKVSSATHFGLKISYVLKYNEA